MKLHFKPVGKPAPPTKSRSFDRRNDLVLGHAFATIQAQNGAQRLVTSARLVILQSPVGAVQTGINLWLNVTPMETGLDAGGLKLLEELLSEH